VSYTHDGNFLITGARQDDALLVWDMRCADQALYKLQVRVCVCACVHACVCVCV